VVLAFVKGVDPANEMSIGIKRFSEITSALYLCLLRPVLGVRGRRNPKNLSWARGHPTRVPFLMPCSCCPIGEKEHLRTLNATEHFLDD